MQNLRYNWRIKIYARFELIDLTISWGAKIVFLKLKSGTSSKREEIRPENEWREEERGVSRDAEKST